MKSIILIILAMGLFAGCGSDSDSGAAGGSTTFQVSKPAIDCNGSDCVQ